MEERHLASDLAKAREELFSADKVMETGMYAEPSVVVTEMINEIKQLRSDAGEAADLHLQTILELQRIQALLTPISDENERLIGVALSELEAKFHKIHDKWSEK